MAMPRKEVIGLRFGSLVVTGEAPYRNKSRCVTAVCDCGNALEVRATNLRRGSTTSCGCYWKSRVTVHGKSQTPLYNVWRSMLDRCNNPTNHAYANYGGRGIHVADEWHDLDAFLLWATSSNYQTGLSIDRRDNESGYSPSNCRWATQTEQQRNRRSPSGSSSQYIGVCLYKATGKWKAHIRYDGKLHHLGYHPTQIEAAIARDTHIRDQGLVGFTMNDVL